MIQMINISKEQQMYKNSYMVLYNILLIKEINHYILQIFFHIINSLIHKYEFL